jgi:PDZ domain-containing protein
VARIYTRLLLAGLTLLTVVLAITAVLYLVPSDDYIFLPEKATPVAPFVRVNGERADHDGGGIYYVAVEVKKASIFQKLFPGLYEGSTLVPASEVNAPGETDAQRRKADLRAMAQSQEVAAAVALQALGYSIDTRSPGTVIAGVEPDGPSAGKLRPRDIVVRVDGKRAPFPADLRRLITSHRPGETVQLEVRRGGKLRHVSVRTVADPEQPSRAIIGVFTDCTIQPTPRLKLPVPVRIDVGEVGGPSAGLPFALDIVEELRHDLDHGHKVAATGELCVDGSVAPVGGLKQKTIGARRAGADIFLVPAGENTEVARRYAGNMRVIPVNSFRQALRELATAARKSRET